MFGVCLWVDCSYWYLKSPEIDWYPDLRPWLLGFWKWSKPWKYVQGSFAFAVATDFDMGNSNQGCPIEQTVIIRGAAWSMWPKEKMDGETSISFQYRFPCLVPSLKLTVRTWKWMVGILSRFLLGYPIFRGELLVSGSVIVRKWWFSIFNSGRWKVPISFRGSLHGENYRTVGTNLPTRPILLAYQIYVRQFLLVIY